MTNLYEAPAPFAPPPAKKKSRKWMWIAGLVVTAVVGIAIGSASAGSKAPVQAAAPSPVTVTAAAPAPVTVTAAAPPTVTVTAPPPAPAAPAATGSATEITKSGTYVVGVDIKAGKWKSDGKINKSLHVGYFAILADPTGSTSDVDNILTNDNPEGQAFATLEEGQGLENDNLHWTLIG